MNSSEAKKLCLSLMNAQTGNEVVNLIKNVNLWDDPKLWREYGDDSMSWTIIGNQGSADFSLNEKIVNGLDAVLMNKCWESGINPKTQYKQAPQSIDEAVKEYFKDMDTRSIAERSMWVSLSGPKKAHPNVCIADLGEGQTPERMPDTILSLAKGNKEGINFVQGNWNTGGSGALKHCGRDTLGDDGEPLELSFILSKRNPKIIQLFPEQKTEHSDKWSFTVVKRNYDPHTGKSHAMCLAPINSDIKPKKGDLLRFESETMPTIPEKTIQCSKSAKFGTLVKLFEYDCHKGIALLLGESLYTKLNLLLPKAFIPYMFHECRKEKSFNTYIEGFSKYVSRLHEKDNSKYLEDKPIKSFITVDGKTLSYEVFIFKKDVSKEQYKSKFGLAWTINGHAHALIPDQLFKSDFGDLHKSMFVVLECDAITGKQRENVFPTSRDRVNQDNPLVIKIKKELRTQLLENNKIKEIEARRNDEDAAKQPEIPSALKKEVQQILSENEIIDLLQFGNIFKQKTEVKKEKFLVREGKKFPSYFLFEQSKKTELKDQHVHIGKNYSYKLSTDVVDDYLTRDNDRGLFKLVWENKENDDVVLVSGGPDIINGVCKFRIEIPNEFEVGENKILKIIISNKKNQEDFVLRIFCTILEKQSQNTIKNRSISKSSKNKKIKDILRDDIRTSSQGEIENKEATTDLVIPQWVNAEDWKKIKETDPNEYSVLFLTKNRDPKSPEGKIVYNYKAYLYEENIFLLKERSKEKPNYTWNMIKQKWWMYYFWQVNGSLVQYRIDKSKNRTPYTNNENGEKVDIDEVKVIELVANSLAMCVFLQQRNLVANKVGTERNVTTYDENEQF